MDEAKSFKKTIIISVLVFCAILAVVFTIFIATSNRGDSQIVNKDSDELKVFKDSDFEHIQTAVKGFLGQYGLSEKEIAEAKIVIREGSVRVKKEDYDGAEYATFLVDVSNPKLTYEGSLMIGGPEEEVFLSCPALSLMQDPNVFCVGNERDSTIDVALGKYLPYNSDEDNGKGIGISISLGYDEFDGMPMLHVRAGVCEGDTDEEYVKKFVKDWVREKGGVNPEIIPMEYEFVDCSGFTNNNFTSDDPDFGWR